MINLYLVVTCFYSRSLGVVRSAAADKREARSKKISRFFLDFKVELSCSNCGST